MGEAWRGVPNAPVSPGQVYVPPQTGGVPRPSPAVGSPQQTFNTLRTPAAQLNPAMAAGESQVAQPSFIQRMAQVAKQVQPVLRGGAAATAVPAAVAAGGAALSNTAANYLSRLTPEQRKMLESDIGSDTGFASAIMNSAQQR